MDTFNPNQMPPMSATLEKKINGTADRRHHNFGPHNNWRFVFS